MNYLGLKHGLTALMAGLLLYAAPAWAKKTADDIPLAVAIQEKGRPSYKNLSENCELEGAQTAPRQVSFAITGMRECNGRQWLSGYYNGDRVYVETTEVFFRQEQLPALQAHDAEKVEDQARLASLYLQTAYLDRMIKEMERKAVLGVAVIEWRLIDESEYTKGTGFNFKVGNFGKKTIKYIWMDVQGLNPVRDPVHDGLGKRIKTVKGVGPIEPDTTGSYRFEYVWHTDLVEYFKVVGLRVQFMDGSIQKIAKPSNAQVSDELLEYLKSDG